MFGFIVRRIGANIIVLWGITVITFLLVFAIPADPARMIAGQKAPESVVITIRHQLGLDQPMPMQYWHYLVRLLHGDMGTSYIFNLPVTTMIGQRAGASLELALGCFIVELAIGLPLGMYTATHSRKLSDYLVSAAALVGISIPVFWLGMVLLFWFGFKLPIFPLGGYGGIQYLILPSITYGITGAAVYTRLLKSSMLEVLNQDYTRTARAKGASESRVIWRHAFRNAVIPVITFGGIDIGYLLTGVLLIETTFNWNGLGALAYSAITNMDIPVIMGTVTLAAVSTVFFNLIVDVLYAVIDPRIRYD
jgi:ABC-type dipeptide/oligopeptide/nickel transport system permease component